MAHSVNKGVSKVDIRFLIHGYSLYSGTFYNDLCAIVETDILNIGDYSARSTLSFLGSRWFCHTYVSTYEIFR